MKKSPSGNRIENRLKSELQENILRNICNNSKSDYSSLSQSLGKDRITILQSIKSLIKNAFVVEENISPHHKKSKRIFQPTVKGICYSIAYLDASIDDMIKLFGDQGELAKYREFVTGVSDYRARVEFMRNCAKLMLELGLFDETGKSKVTSGKELFKIGLASSLVSLSSERNFDASKFFKNQSPDALKKILTKSELKEIKNYLTELKGNIDEIMSGLVRQLD